MKYTILILGLLIAVLISGCAQEPMDGGPCSYQTYNGLATITAINNSEITFTVEVTSELTEKWHLSWQESYAGKEYTETVVNIEEFEEGNRYWVEVDLITEGTCMPWLFNFDTVAKWVDDTSPPEGFSEI